MKKKFLFSIIIAAGLTLGNFSGYQVYGQTESQNKTMKHQTVTYTCPMHPEVIKDKPGNCPKCGMKLVVKKDKMKSGMKCDSTMMKSDHKTMKHDTTTMKKCHMMPDTIPMRHNKMSK